jgi:hypothetical protein
LQKQQLPVTWHICKNGAELGENVNYFRIVTPKEKNKKIKHKGGLVTGTTPIILFGLIDILL